MKKIIAVLLMMLLLTSCTSGDGVQSSSQMPTSSVPVSSEPTSSVPVSSVPVSSEPTKPALSLSFNPAWNHQTVSEMAYIDSDGKVHIAPAFLEKVAAAEAYDGKSGALSVMSCWDTYWNMELWILWQDHTVTYLHMTKEELIRYYPATDDNGKVKDNPSDYPEDEQVGGVISRKRLPAYWAETEATLKGKKVAWLFQSNVDVYVNGFVCTDGTLYLMDGSTVPGQKFCYASNFTGVTTTGKSYAFRVSEKQMELVELGGTSVIQTSYCTSDGSGIRACLQKDGTVVYSSDDDFIKLPAGQIQAVRFFAGTNLMETPEGKIVYISQPPKEPGSQPTQEPGAIARSQIDAKRKAGVGVDQIMDRTHYMVIVYQDGTIEYATEDPYYETLNFWYQTLAKDNVRVKMLSE